MCCNCIFDQIKANLAEIQPQNQQNVQKTHFWQKFPGVNGLNISDVDISGFGRNSDGDMLTFRNCDVERFEIQMGDIKSPPTRASLHNRLMLIGSNAIFTCSPPEIWGKVCSLNQDASKQRARNVPLTSADVLGRARLRDESKECLRGRLHGNKCF